LAAVDALHALACNSPADVSRVNVICNAQRGDLFSATYDRDADGKWVSRSGFNVLAAESWIGGVQPQDTVSGPGVERIAGLIVGRCRVLGPEFRIPQATWIARLGIRAVEAGTTTDLWGVEPLYPGRSSAEIQWEKLHPEDAR
jgi:tRNA threonylcarbamoyladenosine biosynthesis protein TsaB